MEEKSCNSENGNITNVVASERGNLTAQGISSLGLFNTAASASPALVGGARVGLLAVTYQYRGKEQKCSASEQRNWSIWNNSLRH
jgi:hypothetical protein